jgi:F0F1-type ATP synthase delta subunit
LEEKTDLPSKKELEEELSKMREVSSNIDQITRLMVSGEMKMESAKQMIEENVTEQTRIVDRFIELSEDWDSLQNFARIVKEIEAKSDRIKNTTDREEHLELKKQVLDHMEEWINCLEIIIVGVINRASD